MIDIYSIISEMNDKFVKVCKRLTNNITDIEEAVQELHLYFLTMNKQVLEDIYSKDGKTGILKYATVVLNRALTSTRSPFYYKYKKYYTNLYGINMSHTNKNAYNNSIYNMSDSTGCDEYQWQKLEQIDKQLDNIHWYDSNIFKLYYRSNFD